MLRVVSALASLLIIGSCATTPPRPPVQSEPQTRTIRTVPPTRHPTSPVIRRTAPVQRPYTPPPATAPPSGVFAALPGWGSANHLVSAAAFQRSCKVFESKSDTALIADVAPWAGRVSDWRGPCQALATPRSTAAARAAFEQNFLPIEVTDPSGASRFTGYFEPIYDVRSRPTGPYTEPVPALPDDLILNGKTARQKLPNGSTRPYPDRAEITAAGVTPLAFAHPSDVFFLQIQGSGRLRFEDGSMLRAAYAGHNGHPFRSTANYLLRQNKISRGEADMDGIRAWMDRAGPYEARKAMNHNPRYIFFKAERIDDPGAGPKGAQQARLTALGSVAVDTDIHPLGAPMFIQTTSPGLGGDWSGLLIAQDTGNAIKGAVRGDIYFGTGREAGQKAGTQNAPGRMWVLLPRAVALRMQQQGYVALGVPRTAP